MYQATLAPKTARVIFTCEPGPEAKPRAEMTRSKGLKSSVSEERERALISAPRVDIPWVRRVSISAFLEADGSEIV